MKSSVLVLKVLWWLTYNERRAWQIWWGLGAIRAYHAVDKLRLRGINNRLVRSPGISVMYIGSKDYRWL
jgi:hypothetical protein